MPETNTQVGSGQDGGSGAANPNTQNPDASQNSLDAQVIFNLLKGNPEFQQFVKSTAQSKHDKRISEIEKNQSSFREELARFNQLTAGGLSPEVAMEFMELSGGQRQRFVEQVEAEAETQSVATQGQSRDMPNVQNVVKAMGLDGDPRAFQVISEGGSYDQIVNKLAQLTVPVEANPASVMPTGNNQPVPQKTLMDQYTAERDAIGFGKPQLILQLQAKYRNMGLNI